MWHSLDPPTSGFISLIAVFNFFDSLLVVFISLSTAEYTQHCRGMPFRASISDQYSPDFVEENDNGNQ